jgi:3',5'-cyclic AMP phosphodiesterase CpdA
LRSLAAEDAAADPDSWALISDTHIFSKRDQLIRGVKMADNLEQVVREIRALPKKPAAVLHTGDCAYLDGMAEDYTLLSKLLEPLREAGLPLHLGMGNHDHRARFLEVLKQPNIQPPVESRIVSVIESPRVNWFLLDSLTETNKTPGQLGEQQLAWLAKALDTASGKPAIICVHHQPDPGKPETGGLRDTDALYKLILPRKFVKAVVFGHTHTWKLSEVEGVHLVNLPPTAYKFGPMEPNGWVHCQLGDSGATLELRALDTAHAEHGKKFELKWRAA